jgi:hypothetical protein
MDNVKVDLRPTLIPKTDDGLMQLQFFLVGVVVTVLMASMFLWGMRVGFKYGLNAAGVGVNL